MHCPSCALLGGLRGFWAGLLHAIVQVVVGIVGVCYGLINSRFWCLVFCETLVLVAINADDGHTGRLSKERMHVLGFLKMHGRVHCSKSH